MSREREKRYPMGICYLEIRQVDSNHLIDNYFESVRVCVESAFGRSFDEATIKKRLEADVVILGLNTFDKVVGFATLQYTKPASINMSHLPYGEAVALFDAAAIHQSYQGCGIYKQFNRLRLENVLEKRIKHILARTQNPRVEAGIQSVLTEYAEQDRLRYTFERIHTPHVYGMRLTKQKLETKNTVFDYINIDEGDAFLLSFKIETRKW